MIGFISRHVAQKATCAAAPLVTHLACHKVTLPPLAHHLTFGGMKQEHNQNTSHNTPPCIDHREALAAVQRQLSRACAAVQRVDDEYCPIQGHLDCLQSALPRTLADYRQQKPSVTQSEVELAAQGFHEILKKCNSLTSNDTVTEENSGLLAVLILTAEDLLDSLSLREKTINSIKKIKNTPPNAITWAQKLLLINQLEAGDYYFVKEFEKANKLLQLIMYPSPNYDDTK